MKNIKKKIGLIMLAGAILFGDAAFLYANDNACDGYSAQDCRAYKKFLQETDSSHDY